MWLGIIAIIDKLLGIIGAWLPWQLKRSDESKKARDAAQKEMQEAALKGDEDAYWAARSRRDRA